MYSTSGYFSATRFPARSCAPDQVVPAMTLKCSIANVTFWAGAAVGCATAVGGTTAVAAGAQDANARLAIKSIARIT